MEIQKHCCLNVLHIARRFTFIAGFVAANGTHLIVIVVVLVGIFGSVLVGVFLYVLYPMSALKGAAISSMYTPLTFAS
jgi:hypothetical protein